jgi:hypothetical protein
MSKELLEFSSFVGRKSKHNKMKKIILTFGLIAGILESVFLIALIGILGCSEDSLGMILGFAAMILSLTLVFFGIKSYRDQYLNGSISFGKAFVTGISIALICCTFYVVTWMIMFYNFFPDFADQYGDKMIQEIQKSSKSAADIEKEIKEIMEFKVNYKKPVYLIMYTMVEVLPVGILVTLISAAILRTRKPKLVA